MPALTPVVEKLETVAEPLRPFYEQKEGKFHLILDGAPSGFAKAQDLNDANAKVIEFRTNNIALTKEVEELRPLKSKFDGLDPVEAKAALEQVKELGKKGVNKPDDIQAMINAALKPITEQLTASQTAQAEERKRADQLLLKSHIGERFNKAGGKTTALDYIVQQASADFEVKDGNVVAKANKFSTAKPGEPLNLEEWMTSAIKTHDFAFGASNGSGAEHRPSQGSNAPQHPVGQLVLKNPTAAQLGQHAIDIKAGKMRVEYDSQSA